MGYVLIQSRLTDWRSYSASFMLSNHISTSVCNYSAYCTYKIQEVYISSPIFIIVTTKSVYIVFHLLFVHTYT